MTCQWMKLAVKNFTDGTYESIRATTKAHKVSDSERALHDRTPSHYRTYQTVTAQYKRKDDLIALACALALPMEGAVVDLVKVIKDPPCRKS